MKRLLLPALFALAGILAGGGAGFFLRPEPPDESAEGTGDPAAGSAGSGEAATGGKADSGAQAEEPEAAADGEPTRDYVKFNNQFVVPVVEGVEVRSLVILSLTLEVKLGSSEAVYAREPKLRDSFLQVLFDHANSGGFDGVYTGSNNMDVLRRALLEAAQKSLGAVVSDVLIVDIVRQDA